MNKKITILISSLVVIALLAVVSFWVVWDRGDNGGNINENQNNNENSNINENGLSNGEIDTSNWLTYENEEYGYSIKYPNDWNIREIPDTKTGARFTRDNCTALIDIGGATEFYINEPFDKYVKHAAPNEIENYESLNSLEKIITNSGAKGYITTWKGDRGISSEIVYFEAKKSGHYNNIKSIKVYYDSKSSNYCSKIILTMIKTFDYTD